MILHLIFLYFNICYSYCIRPLKFNKVVSFIADCYDLIENPINSGELFCWFVIISSINFVFLLCLGGSFKSRLYTFLVFLFSLYILSLIYYA